MNNSEFKESTKSLLNAIKRKKQGDEKSNIPIQMETIRKNTPEEDILETFKRRKRNDKPEEDIIDTFKGRKRNDK